MNGYKFILVGLVVFSARLQAQSAADSVALVKDFNKVMSFIKQPYLYYTTSSWLTSEPILSEQDTLHFKGTCYKQSSDLYYFSANDEIFFQDSFYIKINHQRKTLWVSKIDLPNKEKLTNATMNFKHLQDVMLKHYRVKQLATESATTAKLQFINSQYINNITTTTTVLLEYNIANYLPTMIEMEIYIQQPITEDILALMKEQHLDENKLVQVVDGNKYVVRKQKMHTVFTTIESGKAVAIKIPDWKTVVDYNIHTKVFTGKAALANYTVTQMF